MPLVSEINEELDEPIVNDTIVSKPVVTYNPTELHQSVTDSRDKLFFISYIPDGTMIRRCYLVQMDMCA